MPPEEKQNSTRERLIYAAMRLFQEQGYTATGVSTILREAGVNAGSLYHYFSSKEELLKAVLETYAGMLDQVVMKPQREAMPDDPVERVFTLLEWYRAGMEQTGCTLGCPIGNLALEVSDHLPEVRNWIEWNFEGWCKEVQRWLDEAGDRFPAGTDTWALSRFVLTVMEGGIMQSRAERSLEAFDQGVVQLHDYFELLMEQGSGAGVVSRVAE
jgi:TetR/AcrR family transcriptional regulator, transcriptional repressor for nem operon